MAIGSRAWMLAMPEAATIRVVAASRIAAWLKISLLPSVSGIHTTGYPSASSARAAAPASPPDRRWRAPPPQLHTPTGPSASASRRPPYLPALLMVGWVPLRIAGRFVCLSDRTWKRTGSHDEGRSQGPSPWPARRGRTPSSVARAKRASSTAFHRLHRPTQTRDQPDESMCVTSVPARQRDVLAEGLEE